MGRKTRSGPDSGNLRKVLEPTFSYIDVVFEIRPNGVLWLKYLILELPPRIKPAHQKCATKSS